MNKKRLIQIIREELVNFVKSEASRLKDDDPGKLHQGDMSRCEWVKELALKNPYHVISLSDIADALGTTRFAVKDTYGRCIRSTESTGREQQYTMVVQHVPFKSCAIYQFVGSKPLTDEEKRQLKIDAEHKFGETSGVFYPLKVNNGRGGFTQIAWISLRQSDNINDLRKILPDADYVIPESPAKRLPSEYGSDSEISDRPKGTNLLDVYGKEDFINWCESERERLSDSIKKQNNIVN